jgi:manganese-dependent inorganic pyrophosphatase
MRDNPVGLAYTARETPPKGIPMTTLVFGHKSPDTDATMSAIVWAWYLTNRRGGDAEPRLLGEPNTEAAFVLQHWGFQKPAIIADVDAGQNVVIVDTNNPAELPPSINDANIMAIIDHHMLVGGLKTKAPINIVMRPLACTATVMHDIMGTDVASLPREIKGAMLSCIVSDTLEFRSPTTTDHDRAVAEALAADLGVSIPDLAARMFEAKSDVSAFSDTALLRMDSKEYNVAGKELRVSVLETTAPKVVLDRKASLMAAMVDVAKEDGADQVLLFVVDILKEEATLLVPNDLVKRMAEASFGVTVTGDTVVLPGVMSRKKQIIPALKL